MYVLLVYDILKGRRFDTIEVTEAESQAMLNALTEHDFQDAFKKW
jgi:N-dimethylarginine dimethylaminohydrolase